MSEIASRDDSILALQRKVEELEGAGQGLKEALLTKASMTALRDMQASTATTEELNHMKSHNAHLNAQLERASAEVASLTARVASLAKHVDGNDEATSNAIKTHTARFQSDIDRVLRNVERVDTERSSEIQSLSARIADLHAALYRKADCSAVEQTAEAALSKDAFNTHMQSYMTRTALMQRLEPMDLGIASLQAGLAGVKDTMQVSHPPPLKLHVHCLVLSVCITCISLCAVSAGCSFRCHGERHRCEHCCASHRHCGGRRAAAAKPQHHRKRAA